MPTVPTTFVPQVSPDVAGDIGSFQAPQVQVAENLAGPQMARFGQAMTAAGNVTFRIGAEIQDDLDNAAAKEADVQAIRAATPVMQQYLSTSGKDAETQYAAALDQVRSATLAPLDGIQSKTARSMYEQVAARNLSQFEAQLNGHRIKQAKTYAAGEAAARSETRSDLAIVAYAQRNEVNPATGKAFGTMDFDANLGIAIREAEEAARLNGIPADSAQMERVRQGIRDKVAAGVVNTLLGQKQFADAEQFLDRFDAEQELDPKARDAIRSSIDKNRQFSVVEELTMSIRGMGYPMSDSDPKNYPRQERPSPEPQNLREALDIADTIPDMETRRAVQARLRSQYAQDEAVSQDAYNALLDQTEQAQASGRPLAPEMLAGLKPTDLQRIMRGEQAKTDANIEFQLADNPMLANDPEWMRKNFSRMSLELRTKIRAEQNKPQAVLEASYDTDMLKRALYDAGMGDMLGSKDAEDKQSYVTLADSVKRAIDFEQRRTGGKLTNEQKSDIIDRAIMFHGTAKVQRSFLGIDFLYPDKTIDRPLSMMTPEQRAAMRAGEEFVMYGGRQYPAEQVLSVQEYLRSKGIQQPTLREVLEYITLKEGEK